MPVTLPPPQYNHPPSILVIEHVLTAEEVDAICQPAMPWAGMAARRRRDIGSLAVPTSPRDRARCGASTMALCVATNLATATAGHRIIPQLRN